MVQIKEKNTGDAAHQQGFSTLKWVILPQPMRAA